VGHIRASNSQRHSIASSLESGPLGSVPHLYPPTQAFKHIPRRRSPRVAKMRPSTPELPDSTDFVCGTFDEDRPLEAAYISCREQKKREKHVPIPQDIDPSFPTTDLEDNDDNDDDDAGIEEEDDHLWLKDQLEGFDEDAVRGRRNISATKKSPPPSPRRYHSPAPKGHVQRPAQSRQNTNRSHLQSIMFVGRLRHQVVFSVVLLRGLALLHLPNDSGRLVAHPICHWVSQSLALLNVQILVERPHCLTHQTHFSKITE